MWLPFIVKNIIKKFCGWLFISWHFCVCLILSKNTFTAQHVHTEAWFNSSALNCTLDRHWLFFLSVDVATFCCKTRLIEVLCCLFFCQMIFVYLLNCIFDRFPFHYCKIDHKKVLLMTLYMILIMFCFCLILGKTIFTALHADTEAWFNYLMLNCILDLHHWFPLQSMGLRFVAKVVLMKSGLLMKQDPIVGLVFGQFGLLN